MLSLTRPTPFIQLALIALSVGSVGCLGSDALNATCGPSNPDVTVDEDCIYQNGRGPQVPKVACVPPEVLTDRVGTWDEVFTIFTSPSRGNCSAAGCHGVFETAANGIYLPDNRGEMYKGLTEAGGSEDGAYLDPDNNNGWIMCNVAGIAGGGFPMPKPSGLTVGDADIIISWVKSGAQQN